MTASPVSKFKLYWKQFFTVFSLTLVTSFSLFSVISAVLNNVSPLLAATDVNTQLVNLINAQRTQHGLPPLSINSAIEQAAASHNSTMATCANQYGTSPCFSHQVTQLGEPALYNRLVNAGYMPNAWEENIAWGYLTAQDTLNGWMNSSGHRANILSNNVTEIGCSMLNSQNGNYKGMYWTCDFGRGTGGTSVVSTSTTQISPPAQTSKPISTATPIKVKPKHTSAPSLISSPSPTLIPSATIFSDKTAQTITSPIFVSLYYKIVCTYWPTSSFCYV